MYLPTLILRIRLIHIYPKNAHPGKFIHIQAFPDMPSEIVKLPICWSALKEVTTQEKKLRILIKPILFDLLPTK